MIAPVNESVWEHLKMGYTALLLFSCLEYTQIKNEVSNYFAAKLAGIMALELTILIIFYSYISFTGDSILWIDILSFVTGVILCQFFSYKLFRKKPYRVLMNRLCLAGFLSLGLLFVFFTFSPPRTGIFKDPGNNTYGIYRKK